jgi:hypothetical protein
MPDIAMVTISLQMPFPEYGIASTLLRMTGPDMQVINKAHQLMGIDKSQFVRMATVRVAEQVLKELGIDPNDARDENRHVDMSRGEVLDER